jgi:hypothetical protein
MLTPFVEEGDVATVVTLTFDALDQRAIDRVEQAKFARDLVTTEIGTTDDEQERMPDGERARVYPGRPLAVGGALAGAMVAGMAGAGGGVLLGAAAFGALLGFTTPLFHPALRKSGLARTTGPEARVDRTFAITISADELSVSVDGELAIAVEMADVVTIEPRTSSANEKQLAIVRNAGSRTELPMRFASAGAMHALARRVDEIMRQQRRLRGGAFR